MQTCPIAYRRAKENPTEALQALGINRDSSIQEIYLSLLNVAGDFGAAVTGVADPKVEAVAKCLQGNEHAEVPDWVLAAAVRKSAV
jgi:hypothetical protein